MTADESFAFLIKTADELRAVEVARLAAEVGVSPEVWLAKCELDVLLKMKDGEPVWTYEARRRVVR